MRRFTECISRQPTLRMLYREIELSPFGAPARETFQRFDEVAAQEVTLICSPVVKWGAVTEVETCQELAMLQLYRIGQKRKTIGADLVGRMRMLQSRGQ